MLRADAFGLVLGLLLILTGLATLVFGSVLRRRAVSLLWLGAFSLLYGSRLLERAGILRLSFDVPTAVWERIDAAMTYTVPIPIVLFARAIFPAWRRFWTSGAIGLAGFAVYGVIADATLDHAHSAGTVNNGIAIAFFVGVIGWVYRPGLTPSRELQALRIGALSVSVAAVADNLRGMKVLAFPGPDLEPIGFTVLIASLATVATWRVVADAHQLVVINRELDIARQIQSSILPQAMPQMRGLTVVSRYRPLTAVAGDFYDFVEIDTERLGILVADVAGHGVPAALLASMVKVALAAQRDHADSPAAVLAGMNQTLCGRLAGQYVTAAYLFIDIRSRMIRYGAAGHPPMLRSTRGNGEVDEVEQNGLMLGFVQNHGYTELQEVLRRDDRFLLYTDGLIEACNADDEFFGIERLKASLTAATARHAEDATDDLLTSVHRWSGRPAGDDLTLVLVDWNDRETT
ncbi:PP2C family protein-serine/threonine phosphatase [Luteitalea pratensis]|nr:PP2C family protein-serine/threonine phosphatase [Luteitalea pratensis]